MANYIYTRTFFATYDFSSLTLANARVVTTQALLVEACTTFLNNFISRWPRFAEFTYDATFAINITIRRIYIYITFKNYKANFGFNSAERGPVGSIATGKFNGTRFLLGAFLDKSLVSGSFTTDLFISTLDNCTLWTSDVYQALPAGMFGTLIFSNFLNLSSQLSTAGYFVHNLSADKTVYEVGSEQNVMLDHYSEIKSASQAINAVTLQQDPNQIVLNDKTQFNIVMQNYAQLYILSYYFKTKKLPKFVT